MEKTAKGIPLSLRAAFQEYSLEQLDPLYHRFTIMERTLAHGRREEVRWLFDQYGAAALRQWVCGEVSSRRSTRLEPERPAPTTST